MSLTILYEDARVLVVSKPPNLLTVPPPKSSPTRGDPTLVQRLREAGHLAYPVHRLDKETSGAVLFAKDEEAREILMAAFKAKEPKKIYHAFVQGVPRAETGILRFKIKDLGAHAVIAADGQPAETHYRRLTRYAKAALLEVELKTGRHNQIRLHFAHIGHPLVGERKYAFGKDAAVRHKRCALHAATIAFESPDDGVTRTIEAPWPQDLKNLDEKLKDPQK